MTSGEPTQAGAGSSRNYRQGELHALFARSGDRCALCRERLSVDTSEGKSLTIGEVAHIIGHSPTGPRGCASAIRAVDNYDNLILLCPTCHTKVDKDAASWSVDDLQRIKREHEHWVQRQPDGMFAELEGVQIVAEGILSDSVEGMSIEAPTRLGPGTSITARGLGVKEITGLRIGPDGS